jgi:soluble lytic murein transglycosylase-like protein
MSSSALGVTANTGAIGAAAAAERMQQLQTLIAQVERGPAGFAAALDAAQASSSSAQTPSPTGVAASTTSGSAATATSTAYSGLYGSSAASTASYPGIEQGTTQSAVADQSPSLESAATFATPAGASAATTGGAASAYVPLIEQAAARNGVDPAVLYGLIEQESGFDPSATSSAGALGLTQLMPGTASSLGVSEPLNPAQSIEGGARYLGQMLRQFAGNTADALAAYNAGPGAVQQYGGVPPYPETQQYVSKVLANAAAYSSTSPATTYNPSSPTGVSGAIA